ncbi:unnamed protein product [Boreogadus saida]
MSHVGGTASVAALISLLARNVFNGKLFEGSRRSRVLAAANVNVLEVGSIGYWAHGESGAIASILTQPLLPPPSPLAYHRGASVHLHGH